MPGTLYTISARTYFNDYDIKKYEYSEITSKSTCTRKLN